MARIDEGSTGPGEAGPDLRCLAQGVRFII